MLLHFYGENVTETIPTPSSYSANTHIPNSSNEFSVQCHMIRTNEQKESFLYIEMLIQFNGFSFDGKV